ncbi:MAG: alpha-glucan family phosphorylase [Saprospiraceae bacterium]|nr:alpha-glucan family phosphorylase [Saprospiraceae bacterium]
MKDYRHPYQYSPVYQTRVAYFSMEYGIDQALKIFSGGLGFLAGSHMRSAYDLRQNLIGIGILWKYGYYDQARKRDQGMDVLFMERHYNFLEDPGIIFDISVDRHPVKVKAWYLAPEVFGTVPMYFLSTDLPENDYLAQTICHRLYDSDTAAKIAQYILLGQGGAKLLEKLNYKPDKIHLNEAHGLPAIFYEYYKHRSVEKLREQFVFTTHTPVPAGNEVHDMLFLKKMGFFHDSPIEEIRKITEENGSHFNLTLGALRLSGKANGVSKLHGEVARAMWGGYPDICPIDHITNAQHEGYWTDPLLKQYHLEGNMDALAERKKELKEALFKEVANQTGKIFDPDILTIVWARRFAPYKRADLLTWDTAAFETLMKDPDMPIQIIWAGKPYPMDYGAISVFNKLVEITKPLSNAAVLVHYELALSKLLKQGSDIWLNTPRVTREASGTSGMTAAMNGSLNFTTNDGWIPEFAKNNHNAFVLPVTDLSQAIEIQDQDDLRSAYEILNDDIKPLYYRKQNQWMKMVQNSMSEVVPFFDSKRMAHEYYQKLYSE